MKIGFWLSLFLLPLLTLRAQLPEAPATTKPVGDEACRGCHQQQFDGYQASSHHAASSLPSRSTIKGNFNSGYNILLTANSSLEFLMSSTPDGFFERAVAKFPGATGLTRQERFDIVVGEGRKGQTYLYWKGNELFELPVSYWTQTNTWINSPGYVDGLPNFDKVVVPRCLECHATSVGYSAGHYDTASLVTGITCEKCHGPGRRHVENRQVGKAVAADILNPAKLSRERQMDSCGLCHAGPGTPRAPAFSFAPGDVLRNYLDLPADTNDSLAEVHGHQLQLLESSRCYRASSMTCTTCHDVHTTQRDAASFSGKCLSCHKAESCGEYAHQGAQIATKCVQCHMPLQQSNAIFFNVAGKMLQPEVRSHRIAIYGKP